MTNKKKNPATRNGAEVNLHSNFTHKVIEGQVRDRYFLNVIVQDDDDVTENILPPSDAARSLLILYAQSQGVTRAKALNDYFILSLTQHVFKIRHDWGVDIETERVPPTRYARYHFPKNVEVKIFKIENRSV